VRPAARQSPRFRRLISSPCVRRHDEGAGEAGLRLCTRACVLAAWLLTTARAHASPPVETPACDPANDESCSQPSPEPFPEPQTAVEWYARGIELANAEQFAAAAEAF